MKTGSPCISVCVLDAATGYCRGCARTLEEISNWLRYTPAERDAVWARLAERRARSGTPHPEG